MRGSWSIAYDSLRMRSNDSEGRKEKFERIWDFYK